jgi:hypothetical protein
MKIRRKCVKILLHRINKRRDNTKEEMIEILQNYYCKY